VVSKIVLTFATAFASKNEVTSKKVLKKNFLKKKFIKNLVVQKICLTFAPLSHLNK
jgi:hypothetical protein